MQKEYQKENKKAKNKRKTIIIIVVSMVCLISICFIADSIFLCAHSKCHRPKISGSNYCLLHTCEYPDCYSATYFGVYCLSHKNLICDAEYCDNFAESYAHAFCKEHECADWGCKKQKEGMADYCSQHRCHFAGCKNKLGGYPDILYCSEHQPLKSSQAFSSFTFGFTLNSVGGINFNWKANCIEKKEIKYIRFPVYLYNAVGDPIKAKYEKSSHIDVEIVGPIYSFVNYEDLIGYAEKCAKIVIRDMTIVYADNTIKRVKLNYSYSHGRMSPVFD